MKELVIWSSLILLSVPPIFAAPNEPSSIKSEDIEAMIHQGQVLTKAMSYDQALDLLYQAKDLAERSEDSILEAKALLEIGATLGNSGAPDRSLAPIQEAVNTLEDKGDPALFARSLKKLAEARAANRDSKGAERDFARATELLRQIGDIHGVAGIQSTRSVMHSLRRNYRKSIELGEAALEVLSGHDTIRPLIGLAYSRHQLGQHRAALAHYDRLIELAWSINDQRTLSFAYCNRADVKWTLGEKRPALDDLWAAIKGFEHGRASIASRSQERRQFIEQEIAAYDQLIRFLVDTGDREAAYEVAERLHGRSLAESLEEPQGASLEEEETQLIAQIGSTRLALESTTEAVARQGIRERLRALEHQLRDHRRSKASIPQVIDLEDVQSSVTLKAVQQGLDEQEILVSYWLTDDRTLAWIVGRNSFRFVQMPVGHDAMVSKIGRYLAPLRSRSQSVRASLLAEEDEHREVGRTLYDWLVKPIEATLEDTSHWIIVPDGPLHYLPFEALIRECEETPSEVVHGGYAACHYLGLEKSVSYAASAGTLLAVRQRQKERPQAETGPLLAMAPAFDKGLGASPQRANRGPLHWNDDEVRRIGKWFENAQVLIGDEASEARFKEELSNHRRLHLATHGLVDDAVPQSSGVLLAPTPGEDGLLQTLEILGLNLQADLVTLSACRTGRGPLSRGEGLVGFTQAFLDAGASTLVVSLWDVDDRTTPLLMDAFYRFLADGQRPAEALRQARLELFAQSGNERLVFKTQPVSYAHPRYWASFVVFGADQ